MAGREFLHGNFGIEVELTGITRTKAAEVIAKHLNGTVERTFDSYDTHKITAQDQRVWKVMYDGSIYCQRKVGSRKVAAGSEYSVELVSPILAYDEDMETLQEIIRKLRKAGGFSEATINCTGVHVHLDGAPHTARSLRNFTNIIHSRNDLLYEALEIAPERMRYCKKMDARLVERMNSTKPSTLWEIERIWYEGYRESQNRRYHSSRYHFCNLHSFFHGVGTVELRMGNGTLHAGKIRSMVVLALAMNHQALTQKSASSKKPQMDNPKFAMRTWLNRMGLIGDEFKNCRTHLTAALVGSSAWRFRRAG